jgi:RHS repeat-associated protein
MDFNLDTTVLRKTLFELEKLETEFRYQVKTMAREVSDAYHCRNASGLIQDYCSYKDALTWDSVSEAHGRAKNVLNAFTKSLPIACNRIAQICTSLTANDIKQLVMAILHGIGEAALIVLGSAATGAATGAGIGAVGGTAFFGIGAVPGAGAGAIAGFFVGVDVGLEIVAAMGIVEMGIMLSKVTPVLRDHYRNGMNLSWGAWHGAMAPDITQASHHFAKANVLIFAGILMALLTIVGVKVAKASSALIAKARHNAHLAKALAWLEANPKSAAELEKAAAQLQRQETTAPGARTGEASPASTRGASKEPAPKTDEPTPQKDAQKKADEANNKEKENLECKSCVTAAPHPVNPVFGCKLLEGETDLDFDLPAILPLPWQRRYCSDNPVVGILGQGWSLPVSLALEFRGETVILLDPQYRKLTFAIPAVGASDYSPYEQLTLERIDALTFDLVDTGLQRTRFKLDGPNSRIAPLLSITDRNGNAVRVRHNIHRQPVRIHDSAGRVFALQYNRQDRLEIIGELRGDPDAAGNYAPDQIIPLAYYEYNGNGDLIRVRNRVGQITREFDYKHHMLIRHSQPGGLVSHYEYSDYTPQGKVIRTWANTGQQWTLAYGKRQTIVTDHLGRREYYRFNDAQRYTGKTDALGGKTLRKLDKYGKPEAVFDAAGRATRTRYDQRGRAIEIEQPDGAITRLRYHDHFDQPIEITDALGNTTRLAYDHLANLVNVTDALGQVTHYQYTPQGLPEVIIDAKGGRKQLAYNPAGQLTTYTDCSGNTTQFQYSPNGHLVRTEDAQGQLTHYEYDPLGKLVKAIYPDQSEEHYEYDPLGRLIAHIDAAGSRTSYTLDLDGKPLARTNALGHQLKYQYDPGRRLAQLVNENGAIYAFGYDPLDRLIEETGFDKKSTRYRYDPTGLPIAKEELGSPVDAVDTNTPDTSQRIDTAYTRDRVGRLIEKSVARANDELRTRYTYDALGRLTEADNGDAKVTLRYDAIGQLVEEHSRTEDRLSTIRHAYDALGNRIQTMLPDGRVLNQLFYGSGHLHQVNLDGEIISDVERDRLHREIKRTQGELTSHYRYDPLGRLKAQLAQFDPTHATAATASPARQKAAWEAVGDLHTGTPDNDVVARRYDYDKSGNLVGISDKRFGKTVYGYDAIGRILSATQPQAQETFAFDPAHNLIDAATAQANGRMVDNRLTVFEDKRFEYDAHGNLTSKKVGRHTHIALKWNAEHQLVESTTTRLSAATEQTTHYGYDPFGRRIFKRDRFGTTYFSWDGNRLLAETRGSKIRTYLYEPDSFVPLAQVESAGYAETDTSGAEIFHFHKDHLGTPRELTDHDGNLRWAATYKAWGNVLKVEVPQGQAQEEAVLEVQPLRFQGQYFDVETGLHYNRFRYFDSDIGRFISSDPIGLNGGNNLYQYAPNPTVWIDPFGLMMLYRSMSEGEYADLMRDKVWRSNGGMEGKWFAESYDNAVKWGQTMGHGGDKFHVVEVDVPDNIAKKMHTQSNLDGIGSARYAEVEDLNNSKVKIKSSKTIDAKCKC